MRAHTLSLFFGAIFRRRANGVLITRFFTQKTFTRWKGGCQFQIRTSALDLVDLNLIYRTIRCFRIILRVCSSQAHPSALLGALGRPRTRRIATERKLRPSAGPVGPDRELPRLHRLRRRGRDESAALAAGPPARMFFKSVA